MKQYDCKNSILKDQNRILSSQSKFVNINPLFSGPFETFEIIYHHEKGNYFYTRRV